MSTENPTNQEVADTLRKLIERGTGLLGFLSKREVRHLRILVGKLDRKPAKQPDKGDDGDEPAGDDD